MSDRKPCECTSIERCTGVPLPAGFYCRAREAEVESYDDPYDDQFEEELDEYEAFDCHMDRSGHCGAAGSEDCEFECQYRRDQYARERERERKAQERRRSKGGRQPRSTADTEQRGKVTRKQLVDLLAETAWLVLNHDNDPHDGEPHNVANWKNLTKRIDAVLPKRFTNSGDEKHG